MEIEKIWKEGYKVVSVQNPEKDIWGSSEVSVINLDFCIYSTDCITKRPRGAGPLCVFRDLEYAKQFYPTYNNQYRKLFECKYIESSDIMVWFEGRKIFGYVPPILGTVLADEVQLIKMIRDDQGDQDE